MSVMAELRERSPRMHWCDRLGALVKETARSIYYRRKGSSTVAHAVRSDRLHLVPCPHCHDYAGRPEHHE